MNRLVINQDNPLKLLQEILHTQRGYTTVIICSTKRQYLKQLLLSISAHQPARAAALDHNIEPHPLLIPTLQLLSNSKAVRLAFCPTFNTLRAYLSSFTAAEQAKPNRRDLVLIIDLVSVHHATSEFSAQGLMCSFASAVEAAARNGMDLHLCECNDILDLQNPDRGPRLWDAQVPLLSGSVRMRGDDAAWSRRVVSVRSIAGRWFEFEEKEKPRDEQAEEDEEMLV